MLSVAINDSLAARKTEALIPWRFPASSGFEPEAAQAASSSLAEAGSLDLQPVSRPTRLPNGASLPAGSASMGVDVSPVTVCACRSHQLRACTATLTW